MSNSALLQLEEFVNNKNYTDDGKRIIRYSYDYHSNDIKRTKVIDDEGLEKAKAKIGPGYSVSRYKGLGEMSSEQLWDTTMNPKTRLLIKVNIEDPLLVEYRVGVLMGNDTSLRKKWVEENVNFNLKDEFMKEVKR